MLVRWANKYDKKVLTMSDIKNSLRKTTKNSEEEIALLLKHAEHSGKVVVEKLSDNDESTMCKFAVATNEKGQVEETVITPQEKAEFFLNIQISKIDEKTERIQHLIDQVDSKIKSLLKKGEKESAVVYLQKRKMYEKE